MTEQAIRVDETAVMMALAQCHERGLLPSADRTWTAGVLAQRQAQGYLEPATLNQAASMLHRHRQVASENGIVVPELPAARSTDAPTAKAPTGPRVEITIASTGELMIAGAPFELRDVLKTLPGHRWDRRAKAWFASAAPAVAAAAGNAVRKHGCQLAMGTRAKALAVEHTRRRDTAAILDPAAPVPELDWASAVTTQPWEHQLRMAEFIAKSSATVAAVPMGGGKTLATILALNLADAQRVLTVCPNQVRGVWRRELAKHSVRPWHVVDGRRVSRRSKAGYVDLQVPDRLREAEEALFDCACGRPHMVAINYEVLPHEVFDGWAPRERFDSIVYDEVHRLKSHSVKTKSGGLTVSGRAATWVALSDKRVGLSGTPISTDPAEDAFGVYRALDPGIFGTNWTQHEAKYQIKNPKNANHVIGYRNLAELARLLSLIMYRPQVQLDLPPSVTETVEVELDKPTMRAYREMEAEMVTDLTAFLTDEDRRMLVQAAIDAGAPPEDVDGELTAANPMVRLLRLQQLTGGVLATDDGVEARVWDTGTNGDRPSPKGEALSDVLRQVGCIPDRQQWSAISGSFVDIDPEPVVVFCRFASDLAQVREVATARGLRYREISGPRKDGLTRDSTLAPDADVCGVQIQAGGTGIELVRARIVVWWSVGYSLVDFDQAVKRVHRPGQTRPVLNIHLVATGTADEAVYQALDQRRSTVAGVYRMAGFDDAAVDDLVHSTAALPDEHGVESVDRTDASAPEAPELRSDAKRGQVVSTLPFLDAGEAVGNEPVYKRDSRRRKGSPTKRPAPQDRTGAQLHADADAAQEALFGL